MKSAIFDRKSILIKLTKFCFLVSSAKKWTIWPCARTWVWHDRLFVRSSPMLSGFSGPLRTRPSLRFYRVITVDNLEAIKWSFRGSNWIDLVERVGYFTSIMKCMGNKTWKTNWKFINRIKHRVYKELIRNQGFSIKVYHWFIKKISFKIVLNNPGHLTCDLNDINHFRFRNNYFRF